ncbi:PEP-CTERM sorting domain-containing protein [Tropicimonas sp. IMCC6043]|uniref:PEP-CTERM sorting domain-containing protein n=1 Tax=Tropicimonas sp. IMCC6043 TaxID=2510645 RepID=UPI00101CB826|nr:PEP-CTERM sorting domain-containing protein [Tropicimonas sp. IMCC6043]RYH09725.1 PEP-CTERM sorting domain-containing protein [Tropicimonas sp. IMCC6043]
MSIRSAFFALPIAAASFGAADMASAVAYEAPVASNAYITMNGLDWAWAAPWAYDSGSGGFDLTYQSQFGWRLPTVEELLNAPGGLDFQFAGANVPLAGTDPVSGSRFSYSDANLTGAAACAAAYFSDSVWCDWGNAPDNIAGPVPWAGQPGYLSYSDTLVVRDASPIPVPGAVGLLLTGIASLYGFKRRRKAA